MAGFGRCRLLRFGVGAQRVECEQSKLFPIAGFLHEIQQFGGGALVETGQINVERQRKSDDDFPSLPVHNILCAENIRPARKHGEKHLRRRRAFSIEVVEDRLERRADRGILTL